MRVRTKTGRFTKPFMKAVYELMQIPFEEHERFVEETTQLRLDSDCDNDDISEAMVKIHESIHLQRIEG